MGARVTINRSQLDRMLSGPGGGGRLLRHMADQVAAAAQVNAADHGSIPSTISAGPVTGRTVTVLSAHRASVWVHQGTRPHPIRPRRRGGVLRFEMGGRIVYARSVRHPGYRGDPYLVKALREVVG